MLSLFIEQFLYTLLSAKFFLPCLFLKPYQTHFAPFYMWKKKTQGSES
jgi:hypothetical protein